MIVAFENKGDQNKNKKLTHEDYEPVKEQLNVVLRTLGATFIVDGKKQDNYSYSCVLLCVFLISEKCTHITNMFIFHC